MNAISAAMANRPKRNEDETNKQLFGHVSWATNTNTIYVIGSPILIHPNYDEMIIINVGGEVFQTFRKTLEKYPDTLLGNHKVRQDYYNMKSGELFFDRHSEAFECILYFYQSEGDIYAPYEISLEHFIGELVFFRMGESVIERLELDTGVREPFTIPIYPKLYPLKMTWKILEYPSTSRVGKIIAYSTVVVILISILMFVLETLPKFTRRFIHVNCNNATFKEICRESGGYIVLQSKHDWWMNCVNTGVIIWFTSECLLRFLSCPHKLRFFLQIGNIIDLLSIFPYYVGLIFHNLDRKVLGIIRVFRVIRVLKLSRYSRGLQVLGKTMVAAYEELAMLAFCLIVFVLISSSVMFYLEHKIPGTGFQSIPHSAWWAVVTLTTVGYGDLTPASTTGRVVGFATALCSVIIMALPIPSVVSHFAQFYKMEKNRKQCEEAKKVREEYIKRQREEEKERLKNMWI